MRKLNRPQPGPTKLAGYNYQTQEWTQRRPDKDCRRQIWQKLTIMQGQFCAFCERSIFDGNRHIEHFFHKGQKPDGTAPYKSLTFVWGNLFGCCGLTSSNTCGHYKDRQGPKGPGPYNPNDLIKPDIEDPSLFFDFLGTGVVEPKQGLSKNDRRRAEETIRILNLKALNGVRKRQIDIFKKEVEELAKISQELTDVQLNQEIDRIKGKIQRQEHQTAILNSIF